jgi:long-chain acyl-CoA synthetase
MSHGSGLYILPYVAKAALQIIPDSGGFDPIEIAELLLNHKNVNAFFAPTMVTRLINAPEIRDCDTTNLKTIIYGGGPMYVEDCLKALDLLGPKLVQIYGQGEAPMTITALSRANHMAADDPRYLEKLASVGTARSDLEVSIFDENDSPLPAGEIGEVCVRGDVVMRGYWKNEQATNESLRDGWLHTGDMGTFDEEGYLTLKDRSKDVIISGGSNIYPREVEEILLKHEGVLEAAIIGRPHQDWGEEVVAFIVQKPDCKVQETELDQICLDHIARFKRPKEYRFVDALPKNNYGKILKTKLRLLIE